MFSFASVFLETLPGSGQIYRRRAPKPNEIPQLQAKQITRVLIFKNQTGSEVQTEINALTQSGVPAEKIYHIPFQWKDFSSEQVACEQIVDALSTLADTLKNPHEKILFHCTVGEDRTGLLAGLMTQLLTPISSKQAYISQMCMKGFSGGNHEKPLNVQQNVDRCLTPLYFKMSELIRTKRLRLDHLDKNICVEIIQAPPEFPLCSEIALQNFRSLEKLLRIL